MEPLGDAVYYYSFFLCLLLLLRSSQNMFSNILCSQISLNMNE